MACGTRVDGLIRNERATAGNDSSHFPGMKKVEGGSSYKLLWVLGRNQTGVRYLMT